MIRSEIKESSHTIHDSIKMYPKLNVERLRSYREFILKLIFFPAALLGSVSGNLWRFYGVILVYFGHRFVWSDLLWILITL